jgi:hypothetical protein
VDRRPGLRGKGVVLILRGLLRGPRKEAWVQSVWYLEEGSGSVSAGNGLSVEGEMIREHDLVVLKRDRKEAGLEKGDVGTVVLVYPGGGYIVEFVDHEGNTLAVLDLAEDERSKRLLPMGLISTISPSRSAPPGRPP